ncbi:tetratricopeptide repeat protein [Massilia sp. METH4]|uniref:tetratricopeptide repeat protein n=1 Tax=Massilia sp. METH4 TaxID=3123041 RepID=UPI0030CF0327
MSSQGRKNICAALVNLIHEYDSILCVQHKLWIRAFEASNQIDENNLDLADALSKGLIEECQKTGERALVVEAFKCRARIESKRGNWQAEIHYLKSALLSGDPSRHKELFLLGHMLAVAYREAGCLEEAEQQFDKGISYAGQIAWRRGIAMSYNGLGTTCMKRGDFDAAIRAFETAIDSLGEDSKNFALAPIYNNLGLAAQRSRDLEGSLAYFSKSLELKIAANDTCGKAMTMTNMVALLEELGRRTEAVDFARQASELFQELRDYYNSAMAKRTLARQLRRMGQEKEASKVFLEAEDLFRNRCDCKEMADNVRAEHTSITIRTPLWVWLPIFFVFVCFFGLLLLVYAAVSYLSQ